MLAGLYANGWQVQKMSDGRKIVWYFCDDFVKILGLKCRRNNVSKGINLMCEFGLN